MHHQRRLLGISYFVRLHQLAALVSSDQNGGFTGAVIGLYVTGESAARIDFDSLEYTGYSL
nr:hypothetical protein [Paenibacillus sp. ISL-20]